MIISIAGWSILLRWHRRCRIDIDDISWLEIHTIKAAITRYFRVKLSMDITRRDLLPPLFWHCHIIIYITIRLLFDTYYYWHYIAIEKNATTQISFKGRYNAILLYCTMAIGYLYSTRNIDGTATRHRPNA
jgi:hypothetical protein